MPTYKFCCPGCKKEWKTRQSLLLDGTKHTDACPQCNYINVESIPTGGTGTLMKGRRMDKYLEGFPDFTDDKNKKAEKEGEVLEKKHDAYVAESMRKNEK